MHTFVDKFQQYKLKTTAQLLLRKLCNLQCTLYAIVVFNNGVALCTVWQVMPPGKWKIKISQYICAA